MDQYTGFAVAYDRYMDDIPYDRWAENLKNILAQYGIQDGIIAELGCGTGRITRSLRDAGYDMIGIDISDDMLMMAYDAGTDGILYVNQDMREFELYGTARAVISTGDSVNYLTSEDDVRACFEAISYNLDDGGLLIFDVKTEACYRQMGDNTYVDSRDEATLIWENRFDEPEGLNYYDLELFLQDVASDPEDPRYIRFFEQHIQRVYPVDTLSRLLSECGFALRQILDTDTMADPDEESRRIYFTATKGRTEHV